MRRLPDRITALRWLFIGLGWFLFGFHGLVDQVLHVKEAAAALLPERSYLLLNAWTLTYLLLLSLCFLTGWGLKRQREWARTTGLAASALLLFGVPWLTPLGCLTMFLLLRKPLPVAIPRLAEDFWKPGRQSLFGAIASMVGFLATMQCLQIFDSYARRLDMPTLDMQGRNFGMELAFFGLLLFGMLWLHAILHECGHAIAAWMAGFRVKAISAGPLTVYRDPHGIHARFNWRRLLLGGGYVGAIPASSRGVWAREIMVVAAGPATSLGSALALTWLFFQLPGTALAPFWPVLAIAALQGYFVAAINLLPAGYTDGTMLLHLVLRTARGRELIAIVLSGQMGENAHDRQHAGDHEANLTLRRAALQGLTESGAKNTLQLALAQSNLGMAEMAAGSLSQAETAFRASLAIMAQGGGHPAVEADCRIGLHRIHLMRYRTAEADEAYRAAWQTLVRLRQTPELNIDGLRLQGGIVELHCVAGAFEQAVAVCEDALAGVGHAARYRPLRGRLLRFLARCELQLGHPDRGLAAAEECAALWRSSGLNDSERAEAPQETGMLAEDLWHGGHTDSAVSLLRECIRMFEARSEPNPAFRFRCLLVQILWRDGRIAEAEDALPDPSRASADLLRRYLRARASVHRMAGRTPQAVDDCREVLRLTEADPQADRLGIAAIRGSLAEALWADGQFEEAEALAGEAYRELADSNHPDCADACLTLALASRRHGTKSDGFRECLQRFDENPLVLHADKARYFDLVSARLERDGLFEEAEAFRAAAGKHWKALAIAPRAVCAVSA